METRIVCDRTYQIVKLLGHGKGGYSFLVSSDGKYYVLKQIHHEPCDYYHFGNKIKAEKDDYERLLKAGIRIPTMIAIDMDEECIIKEYIEGDTIFEMIKNGIDVDPYLDQVKEMAELSKKAGINIDYFPTNFVVNEDLLWYVDYECNDYMAEWDFDHWGIKYWSMTKEFKEYLSNDQ